jgi:hypothetical protein
VFQTKVEITINKKSSTEFGIIYDYNSRKAEITDLSTDGYYKKLYYFRQNQLYDIERNNAILIKT